LRLKKLEIYGFKSFAERTRMEFGNGITGVVGPNGSGKSNIADAVRWVLGEQSAKSLRGARMEDVIFGGTQARKPLNYCEVTLVFDNEDHTLPIDFAEVQVTRRVYRSGDSEYQLNKSTCRLKDIVDLFRGTGIGREGYSLIGQGRIDDILSVKSEDRRGVFEEAAGITRFKARRLEAQHRMDNTLQNLDRVEDILLEVGAKLPSLEQQAAAARRYAQLMRESRVLEANAFLRRYDALCQTIEELSAKARDCEAQQLSLSGQRQDAQAKSTALEERLLSLEAELNNLNREIVELTRTAQVHKGEEELSAQRITSCENELERLRLEEESASSQGTELKGLQDAQARQAQALDEELSSIQADMDALEGRQKEQEEELSALENQSEDAKQRMIASFNRLTDVKAVSARLTATKESLLHQKDRLQQTIENTKLGIQSAQADLDAARQKAQAAQDAQTQAQQKLQRLSGENAQLTASLQREEGNQQRTSGALREAASRLKMLEQMRRDYEGYQNSVREILRRFQGDQGLYGVVASLLTVPRELERAIDMALGAAAQNIVCRREEDAKRMIDVLRGQRLGRATFLPVEAMHPRTLNARERELLSLPGCIGVASELISYDPSLRPVFENLLGRTVIAKDLDSGIAIMRRGQHAFRLVTLEGDVIHSGGSMTGGSLQARTTSLLSREREIQEYRQAVSRLQERISAGEKEVDSLRRSLQENQALHASLSQELHETDLALLAANSACQQAEEVKSAAEQSLSSLLLEQERMDDSLRQIEAEFAALGDETGSAEQLSSASQTDIAALNERLRSLREALDETRQALAEKAAAAAAVSARQDSLQKEQKRLLGDEDQLKRSREIRRRARETMQQRLLDERAALESAKAALLQAEAQLQEQSALQQSTDDKRMQVQQELRSLNQTLEDLAQALETQRDLGRQLEMRMSRATDERRLISDRLWERHELTYESALELKTDDFSEKQARPRIDEIRSAIRSLGTVNLSAIQEYEETKERFDALSSQKEDLKKAEQDLIVLIRELTREMEGQFLQCFKQINEHFGVIFAQLFGGGTALLKLQDESDCLNCGIDIIAQPPGKKLQLLSLLSGGERALTAIALLFSMLTIRPSPFCILDEIEAALDENNVDGFADYLRNYSAQTQFIVITHRKGTMERCDSLYGVAMEEKGVSRMVSVQLEDIPTQAEEA